jgi:ParB family chromosome partitioning protein
MHLAKISINEIREPARVARAVLDEDALEELAASIKKLGIINPLTVKEVDGGYEVVAGHRRLLAARRAGLVAVPCLVRSARDPEPHALQLHENLYRQELSPVEEAAWFAELLPDCGDDTDRLAELVKQSRNYVESRLNLLRGDPEVVAAVAAHEISLGVAEELNKIVQPEARREGLHWARNGQMTVTQAKQYRVTRNLAAQAPLSPAPAGPAPASPAPPARDIFVCFLCGQSEPKTDLEFWHIHRFCRLQVEARAKEQVPGAGDQVPGAGGQVPVSPKPETRHPTPGAGELSDEHAG